MFLPSVSGQSIVVVKGWLVVNVVSLADDEGATKREILFVNVISSRKIYST
jgi:hypothetical protein